MTNNITTRSAFGGVIPDHKRIPDNHENVGRLQWERAHQQRELAAYLKGHSYFRHGFDALHNPLWYKVRVVA